MKTFERYTEKLSAKEKTVYVPMFINGLKKRIGKGSKITNPGMVKGFKENLGIQLSEPQVRKIIAYIRDNDLLPGLIASQLGYWVSNDPNEIKDYIESLEAREAGHRRNRQAMERYLLKILNNVSDKT